MSGADDELAALRDPPLIDLGNPNVALPPQIGPFAIDGRLGSGGMGVVLDARMPSGQRVALKLIRPTGDREHAHMLAQRLLREARILQQLRHPGIVGVHDSGRVGDLVYLAMDFVEGVTLQDVRRIAPISDIGVMTTLAKQLLETLAVLHEAGIIHRDIKPGNVLIDRQGRSILTDFGIARFAEDTAITKIGQVLGSPGYVAPEILEGHDSSAQADQFALGKLLFEVAALRPPERILPGTPLIVQFRMRIEADWTRFPSEPPWPAFGAVLRRMLAKDPAERFKDCREGLQAMLALENVERASRSTPDLYFGSMLSRVESATKDVQVANPTVFAPANTLNRFLQELALQPHSPWTEDEEPPPAGTPSKSQPSISAKLQPASSSKSQAGQTKRPASEAASKSQPGLPPPPPPATSAGQSAPTAPASPAKSALVAPSISRPAIPPPPSTSASRAATPPVSSAAFVPTPMSLRGIEAPPPAPASAPRRVRRHASLIAAALIGLVLGGIAAKASFRKNSAEQARVASPQKREAVARAMIASAAEELTANDFDGAKQLLESCVALTGAPSCHLRLARLLLLTGDRAGAAHLRQYLEKTNDLSSETRSELRALLTEPR